MTIKQFANIFNPFKIKNKIENTQYYNDFVTGNDMPNSSNNSQLKLGTVYRCVDILSNSISKMPFFITDTGTRKRADDKASKRIKFLLNTSPNNQMTACTFFKVMETNRLLYGNAYAIIHTNNFGYIEKLSLIDPNIVQVEKLENDDIVYKVTIDKNTVRKYVSDEILHIKGFSYNGILGQSVLSYASKTTQNALLQEDYQTQFYERGGLPFDMLIPKDGTVINYIKKNDEGKPDKNGKDDIDRVQEQWSIHNSGKKNKSKIAVLPNGLSYQAIPQISQRDMAFIEAKEVGIADIARYFGIPLYKLFAGKESYQSNEQNGIAYVTDTLTPILTAYEQELTLKLLSTQKLENGFCIKGNLNAEMRGDLATRGKWYQIQQQGGVYSINDIRAFEDMPDIEGGDIRLVSKNYASLEYFTELEKAGLTKVQDTAQENTKGGTG